MTALEVAEETLRLMEVHFHDRCSTSGSLNYGPEKADITHMRYMNARIQSGALSHERVHRWLGWMQAVAYLSQAATFDQLRALNKGLTS